MSDDSKIATGLPNYSDSDRNDIFDFQMPDVPDPIEDNVAQFEDKDPVGFKFGFIGAGQGGGKLAEAFHKIGYARVGAVNTADQDLATVDVPKKFKFGEQQGAGKDRSIAKQAFLNQKEDVIDFFKDCLLYTSPSPRDATLSRMPSSA